MLPPLLHTLLTLLPLTIPALAHSHLAHILINGQLYHGFDPRPNQSNSASRVGWWTSATDDGFVTPANYTHPDIICHRDGSSPSAHAPVRAGDRIHVQWNGWAGPTVVAGATPVPYAEQTISLFEAEGTPVVVLRGTETAPFSGRASPTAEPRARGRYDRS
ncbi:hypothetical protein CHGG_03455 [Chaetomium globosum CBS 148.51]|uniref:Auxiliary Activity family 9 catalytic domain-containing protein n=1 Tax=Chaetomium globosum (strain ATCC 6205 / CBS 148.51 / DSM 1962 / NBRC 6347 / NRRL 1970) TaxID=306901 RepID=Q2H8J9_CHAGB|nr:uncharacterized protein CHGG_03455 [Chaetomium globosum CBS 148.51]EAQ91520.1 hypothetical protein CHGG_03455 [Chaetomium globosum CBS 148.51]